MLDDPVLAGDLAGAVWIFCDGLELTSEAGLPVEVGPDGEEEMSRYLNLHGFIRAGFISEETTQDVVYVQDFLEGYRNWL